MKRILLIAAVLLVLTVYPAVASSDSMNMNIPEKYHGMWICDDENLSDKLLMEITASDIYLNGMPFANAAYDVNISILDYTERDSGAGYSVTMHYMNNDILFTSYLVYALDSDGKLLMCNSIISDHEDYSYPQTFMFLFDRL